MIDLFGTDSSYVTVIQKETSGYRLLSKQHKTLIEIDKYALTGFLLLLPFNRFIDNDTYPLLLSIYTLLLGISFGRASNLIVFYILCQPLKLIVIAYVTLVLYILI